MPRVRPCHFPALVVYNLNHLGLADADRRAAKLRTVRHLLKHHKIVGLQELHAASELEANALFFDHLDAQVFYDDSLNLAILVDITWLNEHFATHHVQITHTQVVPGAIHAISWRSAMGTCYFFNVYAVGAYLYLVGYLECNASRHLSPKPTF